MKRGGLRMRWPHCCGKEMIPDQRSLRLKCAECGLIVEYKYQPPEPESLEEEAHEA